MDESVLVEQRLADVPNHFQFPHGSHCRFINRQKNVNRKPAKRQKTRNRHEVFQPLAVNPGRGDFPAAWGPNALAPSCPLGGGCRTYWRWPFRT